MADKAHQAPPQTDPDEQRLRAASRSLDDDTLETCFRVPEMHCGGCMRKIEDALHELAHVTQARANLSTKRVTVRWRPNDGTAAEIKTALETLGFEVTPFIMDDDHNITRDPVGKRLLLSLAVAGFAAANVMLLSVSVWSGASDEMRQLFHLISGLIAIPAVAYAGQPFFKSAWNALRHKQLNMDVPISLAVLLAVAMSAFESLNGGEHAYFDASVMLLFFLLIGRYLDHVMRERARSAVTQLGQLASEGAVVRRPDNVLTFTPLHEVEVEDEILVTAGERFPIDGTVIKGTSDIDRSLVTGESAAQVVAPGSSVEAGTLNLTGPVEIRATRTASRSFLAEVTRMMETAEQGKARFVRLADRVARIYAPAVHLLALVTFLAWLYWSGGDVYVSIYAAIAVLIITCPCALGLAVPIVQVVGASRLFREGVMIKDGAAFEKLNEIDTVVFDKTGTLTTGKAQVTSVSQTHPATRNAAFALAVASNHPASRAVREFLATTSCAGPVGLADNVSEVPGSGVEGSVAGHLTRLGRKAWVGEIATSVPATSDTTVSTVYFAQKGHAAVAFEITDTLRRDAVGTLNQLQHSGLNVAILSGDDTRPVQHAAQELGVSDAAANLSPGDKVDYIDTLQTRGRKILAVGDGINDAPALAAAHVSMAPSSGSDVGQQASDLVFTRESIAAVPFTIEIAKRVNRLVRQNFALALAYNCIAVPAAMLGYVTPLVAALAMSGSSILVVANALRLHVVSCRSTVHDTTPSVDPADQSPRPKFLGGVQKEQAV